MRLCGLALSRSGMASARAAGRAAPRRLVCYVVCGRGRVQAWGGAGERAELSSPRRRAASRGVTVPPPRTPARCPPPPPPSPAVAEGTELGQHAGVAPALQKGGESGLSVWVTQQPPWPRFIHKNEQFNRRKKPHTHCSPTARSQEPGAARARGTGQQCRAAPQGLMPGEGA